MISTCKKNIVVSILFSVIIIMSFNCSNGSSVTGGSTTETTNGFTATVYYENGIVVENCIVTLRPSGYLKQYDSLFQKSQVQNDTTDSTGVIKFEETISGYYAISAIDNNNQGLFIDSIYIDSNNVNEQSDINLYIKKPGSLCGIFEKSSNNTLLIYGTDYSYDISSDSLFVINFLPKGVYSFAVQTGDTLSSFRNIEIKSEDTTFSEYINSGYKGYKRIHFNTLESGLNIIEDITNFPLLLRLQKENYKDSMILETVINPKSLKILDNDNRTSLPFAIERWDRFGSRSAEMWIKVPVIEGASEEDYLTILYGKESSVDTSYMQSEIFDNSYGYSGVWHLQEDNGTFLFDYSNVGNSASKKSQGSPAPYPSIIGFGQRFDGVADQIVIDNSVDFVSGNDDQTIELWIYPELLKGTLISYSGTYQSIEIGLDSVGFININALRNDSFENDTLSIVSAEQVDQNCWTHLSISIDNINDSVEIFLNGQKSGYSEYANLINLELKSTGFYGTIGSKQDNLGYFKGIVDEIRFFRGKFSDAWHRANYDCQKNDPELFNME